MTALEQQILHLRRTRPTFPTEMTALEQQIFDLIDRAAEDGGLTLNDLYDRTGRRPGTVGKLVRGMHRLRKIHIGSWFYPGVGRAAARWLPGPGEDAVRAPCKKKKRPGDRKPKVVAERGLLSHNINDIWKGIGNAN